MTRVYFRNIIVLPRSESTLAAVAVEDVAGFLEPQKGCVKTNLIFVTLSCLSDKDAMEEGELPRSLLIIYATETGNSLDVAERIAKECRRRHFHTRLVAADVYPLVSACQTRAVFGHLRVK